jgi:hypothetical protein
MNKTDTKTLTLSPCPTFYYNTHPQLHTKAIQADKTNPKPHLANSPTFHSHTTNHKP